MGPRYWARKLAFWLRRDQFTDDLREEMELHVELRARKLHSDGIRADLAPNQARRRFGNLTTHYETSAAVWGWSSFERLLQDLRQGVRSLRKAPGFTTVAVLTLAVGLGVNTAIFSLIDAVVLRPLPYPDSGRLVSLYEKTTGQGPANLSSSGAKLGGAADPARTEVSVANLADYRAARAFDGLAHCQLTSKALTGLAAPEQLDGETVSANFFDVLRRTGTRPRLFAGGRAGRSHTGRDDYPRFLAGAHGRRSRCAVALDLAGWPALPRDRRHSRKFPVAVSVDDAQPHRVLHTGDVSPAGARQP